MTGAELMLDVGRTPSTRLDRRALESSNNADTGEIEWGTTLLEDLPNCGLGSNGSKSAKFSKRSFLFFLSARPLTAEGLVNLS
jgi:hypothetical protein